MVRTYFLGMVSVLHGLGRVPKGGDSGHNLRCLRAFKAILRLLLYLMTILEKSRRYLVFYIGLNRRLARSRRGFSAHTQLRLTYLAPWLGLP